MPTEVEALELLSVAQVAAELRLTRRAVIHRIHVGTLTATKLGDNTAAWVITRAEADRAKAHRAATPDEAE